MASITIRNLDEEIKSRLRIQAAHNNRSMEEEVRNILRAALEEAGSESHDLAASIRSRFEPLGGIELPELPRIPMREPPSPS